MIECFHAGGSVQQNTMEMSIWRCIDVYILNLVSINVNTNPLNFRYQSGNTPPEGLATQAKL